MKKVVGLAIATLLSAIFVYCEKRSANSSAASAQVALPSLVSTGDCQNVISIWLEGRKQFHATIESDIPIYSDVRFSGYYEKGTSFLRLVGLSGDQIILHKDGHTYTRMDLPLSETETQGWKLTDRVSP